MQTSAHILRILLLLGFLTLPSLSQQFSINGYVVDGVTNAPLSDLRLHLYEVQDNDPAVGSHGPATAPVTPDSLGNFKFAGLHAGHYSLQAELSHELVSYGEVPDVVGMHIFDVGPTADNREILFRIVQRGVITGAVQDELGDPIEGVGVSIYRTARRGALIGLARVAGIGTDDLGQYRVADLWPGDYVVCAEPPQVSPDFFVPVAEGRTEYQPGGDTQVYTRVCHPRLNDQSGRLHLGAGDQLHIDLTLGSAPSFTVRVTTPGMLYREEDPPETLYTPFNIVALQNGAGYEFQHVPPGRYVLENFSYDPRGAGLIARREFSVTDEAPAPVDLVTENRGTLDVHFHNADGTIPGPEPAAVSFIPVLPRQRSWRLYGTPTYTLDPGSYWLSVRTKERYCLASANLAGKSVTRSLVAVTPAMSATLDLVLDSHCGAIQIHATSSELPAPFANLLLLLSGTPQDPGDAIVRTADAQGVFTIPSIAPGNYLAWAWSANSDGYLGPILADSAQNAVEVVVIAGQPTTASIPVIHAPRAAK